jgi:acyl-CoA reductase-like NAD-dependent aldehyde dehydrogenase
MAAIEAEIGRVPLFMGGTFVDSTADGDLLKLHPATGELSAIVPDTTEDEAGLAVSAARKARSEWSRLRPAQREAALLALADLVEENADALARIESEDTGLPLFLTRGGSLPRAVAHLRHFAAEAVRMEGESFRTDDAYQHIVTREPLGVAAVFVPWNAPVSIATLNLGAALACGNTCVVKAPELAPRPLLFLARLIEAADLPPGVVNVVFGGARAGRALVRHPGVDVVSFTGGVETARSVMRDAAATMKRLVFELGGKSPNVIFADASFDEALDAALLSVFSSNGALCTAGSRILVERPLYADFSAAFAERTANIRVGDPLAATTEVGPMITPAHRERVRAAIDDAVAAGATLLAGGDVLPGPGNFIRPAVLTEVDNAMRIAREEVFGPVAAILPFDSEEEAIAIANDTDYGLAAYVWTSDLQRAMRVSRAVRAGVVSVNAPIVRDLRVPFGGFGHSGMGRVGGRASIEAFTEPKTTTIPIRPYAFPRLGSS